MKLGIFDSGIGGEAVALSLKREFPHAEILTVNDKKHVPYGSRTAQQIISLTDYAIQPLLDELCDVIIIACNSATTAAIETLRQRYPHQKFIGIEPMIKSASMKSKTSIIAVCATPATLASERYAKLLDRYARDIIVIEPDCSTWAAMIESNQINTLDIQRTITNICNKNADVIVLGCTHYHWIKTEIEKYASGRAAIIEPSDAIARRVRALL